MDSRFLLYGVEQLHKLHGDVVSEWALDEVWDVDNLSHEFGAQRIC